MRILITGGCGFIGSNLAVALAKDGSHVTCVDNLCRRGSELLLQRVLKHNCVFVHGDVRSKEDLKKFRGEYDLLIECSAEPSVLVGTKGDDVEYIVNTNLVGSVNCFEMCREHNMPIIFLSTSRVYPYEQINMMRFEETQTRFELKELSRGITPQGIGLDFPLEGKRTLYGATKLCSEILLQEYSANFDLPSIINRCGVVAGPWQLGKIDQGVLTYWMVNHYFQRDLQYIGFGGQGKQVRDVLHIDDLVSLVKKQIKVIHQHRCSLYNVGGSIESNLSLLELTQACQKITGNNVKVGSTPENRPGDIKWFVTDITEVQNAFDWRPTKKADQILQDIYQWLKEYEGALHDIFKVS